VANQGPLFIEEETFRELIHRDDGSPYAHPRTVYGDLSRLVVGWLARTPPKELEAVYLGSGFKPTANLKPLHRVARKWFEQHHPELVTWDSDVEE
jgi:hypothetical protein